MRLYVANLGRQAVDFIYRLPETPSPRMQQIAIGSQILISGTLTPPEVESIVEQHRKYGLVAVNELDGARGRVTLCYSVDKPVPVNALQLGILKNTAALKDEGEQIRRDLAIAVQQQITKDQPRDENGRAVGGDLAELELSVIEEVNAKTDDGHEVIATGVKVYPTAAAAEAAGREGAKTGRRRGRK